MKKYTFPRVFGVWTLAVLFCTVPVLSVVAYDAETTCNMNIWTSWNQGTGKCECVNEGWVYVAVDGVCVEPASKTEKKEVEEKPKAAETKKSSDEIGLMKEVSLEESKEEGIKPMSDVYRSLLDEQRNGQEVSLRDNGAFLEGVKNDTVSREFNEKMQAWQQKLREAESNLILKEGADKAEYVKKAQAEKEIKEQISLLGKEIGFNHQRILEATGVVKYEHMSTEYKKRFKQSSDDTFNDASNAVEFDKASRNINGMMEQTKELKKTLGEKFPDGWQTNYLNVPEKPTREKQEKETGGIWDILLKDKLNK